MKRRAIPMLPYLPSKPRLATLEGVVPDWEGMLAFHLIAHRAPVTMRTVILRAIAGTPERALMDDLLAQPGAANFSLVDRTALQRAVAYVVNFARLAEGAGDEDSSHQQVSGT